MAARNTDFGFLTLTEGKWGRIFSLSRDTHIGASLRTYGEWCEGELQLLLPYLAEDGVVVDVGANVGTHALAFASHCRGGAVMAIEPQQALSSLIKTAALLNGLDNLEVLRAAAGRAAGVIEIPQVPPFRRMNFGNVSSFDNRFRLARTERCEVISLDQLLGSKRIDLVKIDVEGWEHEVVLGAKSIIENQKPIFYFEEHKGDRSDLYKIFKENGYELFAHRSSYYNRDNYFDCPIDIFDGYGEQSYFAAPPGLARPSLPEV